MRRLGEETLALHQEAELPGRAAFRALALLKDDGVEQSPATDLLDKWRADRLDLLAENLAEPLGPVGEVLVDEDIERGHGDGTAERVAAVSRAVLSGLDGQHDLLVGEHAGNGVNCERA